MLNPRQRNIVTYLLEKKQYVTIKELASFFGVSERSIQYDLEKVQYHVNEEGGELHRSKKYGVRLIANDGLKHSALFKPLEVDYNKHYSPKERQDQILKYLFEELRPISTNRFSKLLFISRRTIMEDLKEVEKWLHARELELEYIQNKGYTIEGSEQKFRQAYVEMLANHYNLESLPVNLTVLTNDEYAIIRRAVNKVLNRLNHNIVQSSIDALIFHIAITIHRIRYGYKIEMPTDELQKLEREPEFQIAKEIKEEIEKQFELTVPEAEIGYITLHLLGAKKATVEEQEDFTEQALLMHAIHDFIEKISLQFGVDLTNDELLKKGLLVHLRPAIYRLRFHLRNENPLKDEIYQRYPDMVATVEYNIEVLEKAFAVHFNKDEIAYIALHVGSAFERKMTFSDDKIRVVLVCGSGVGTSQLLKSRVERYYREIDIIAVFSIYDLSDHYLQENQIDWIISTIPIADFSVPVIHVSPFLTGEDRENIDRELNIKREKINEKGEVGLKLNELMTDKIVQWDVSVSDWQEAVTKAVDLLIKDNKVTSFYLKAIMDVFEKNGPYMVIDHELAMPHARPEDGVKAPGIGFIKLKDPVPFHHPRYDPVQYVICLATTDARIHLNALRQLTKLLKNKYSMKKIAEGGKATFMELVNQVSQL